MKIGRNSVIDLVICACLILPGFLLRVYKFTECFHFKKDQAIALLSAMRIVNGEFILLGPTVSIGDFHFGPFYYYFLTISFLFRDFLPEAAAMMTTVFNLAAVIPIYYLVKDSCDRRAAFAAGLLLVVAAGTINVCRIIWNPYLMFFFASVFMFSLYKLIKDNKDNYLLLLALSIGAMVLNGVAAFFVLAICWVYFKPLHIRKSRALYSVLIFLSLMIPTIIYELKHAFIESRLIFKYLAAAVLSSVSNPSGRISSVLISFVDFFTIAFPVYALALIMFVSIFFFLGAKSLFSLKDRKKHLLEKLLFICLAVFFILLMFFSSKYGLLFSHYFGFLYPLPFLAFGSLFHSAYSRRKIKIIVVVIFLYVILINLKAVYSWYGFMEGKARKEQVFLNEQREIFNYISPQAGLSSVIILPKNYLYSYEFLFRQSQNRVKFEPEGGLRKFMVISDNFYNLGQPSRINISYNGAKAVLLLVKSVGNTGVYVFSGENKALEAKIFEKIKYLTN